MCWGRVAFVQAAQVAVQLGMHHEAANYASAGVGYHQNPVQLFLALLQLGTLKLTKKA